MTNYYLGNDNRWIVSEAPSKSELISNNAQDIPEIIEKLLFQRNIKSDEEIQDFLDPSLKFLHDPFLMDGMDIAVDRIIQAIKKDENILVYGDYDVDGVSATAMLITFIESLNGQIDFYIPDRVDEGYGISDIAVDYISAHDYDLLITVDCGITARLQVDLIYEKCAKRYCCNCVRPHIR